MWTPARMARSTMGFRRAGATWSCASKGVTRMPEMPVSAWRSLGSMVVMGLAPQSDAVESKRLGTALRPTRPLFRRGVVHRDEGSALKPLRDRVERIGLGQDLLRVVLRVLHRAVADPLAGAVVPVAARVGRHAPHRDVADVPGLDA